MWGLSLPPAQDGLVRLASALIEPIAGGKEEMIFEVMDSVKDWGGGGEFSKKWVVI